MNDIVHRNIAINDKFQAVKISELKAHLSAIDAVNFRLPDGSLIPSHFHVTEVGRVDKHFIDCGGTERKEALANFQLWEAGDYDHRLAPQKFQHILNLSDRILGNDELEIEVEYQQATIGKFSLDFDGRDFLLQPKFTACLAEEACGIPVKKKVPLGELRSSANPCCAPGGDCN